LIEDEVCADFVDYACTLRYWFLNQPVQKPMVLSFSFGGFRTKIYDEVMSELEAHPRELYPVLEHLIGAKEAMRFRAVMLRSHSTKTTGQSQYDFCYYNLLLPKIMQALASRVDFVLDHSDRVRVAQRDYIECTRQMADAGIFMVVGAGNEGLYSLEYGLHINPSADLSFLAQSPYVMPVGAYEEERDGDYSLAYFSSSGTPQYHPIILAPGFSVARNGERLTGTSLSAPYVAATIALMLQQNPDLNLQQITSILKSTARPLKSVSPLLQGAGRVDVCAAVKAAQRARKFPHHSGAG
jgi:hypothetical protein